MVPTILETRIVKPYPRQPDTT